MIVKICGIRSLEMAKAAETAGADFIGFVFAESRRFVKPELAEKISKAVSGVKKVGVFVNAAIDSVKQTVEVCQLDYVQLHGNESEEYCRAVGCPVIKAFRFGGDFSVERANVYPSEMILVDSGSQLHPGGTGKKFAWQEAAAAGLALLNKPFIIAGGLDRGNVREAMELFRPYGIDVSGGVETDGAKSARKIYDFIQVVRENEWRVS
jgi:phosphoribosylanthranilate isomerase